ncbi:MAG: ferritin-like domain-containing protein [Rhodocyclales bacterium]|nr:ferritin-like domain-containing protein [Rhodocyclales bacterium]
MLEQHDLHARAYGALMEPALEPKLAGVEALLADWASGAVKLRAESACPVRSVPDAGRPARPELIPHTEVPRRSPATPEGFAALLHAIAHIEFNAINLALDCVYRFRGLPRDFYAGWLQVAGEEAYHFGLVRARLRSTGHDYGDFPAHRGLWDMALKTEDDPLVRMALVPRVLEARGLDATPPIVARLKQIGDAETIAVLDIILRDEVGHVALGDRWFRHFCRERGWPEEETYLALMTDYEAPWPPKPLNVEARLKAGFTPDEIRRLEGGRPRRQPA